MRSFRLLQSARFGLNRPVYKWICSILGSLVVACGGQSAVSTFQPRQAAPGVMQVGRIANPTITESSGVTAARVPGRFWTHSDGGGLRGLYAIDKAGQAIGEFRVSGPFFHDWEDISSDGRGHLFLADTGNNEARREEIAVHQIDEPDLTKITTGTVPITRTWKLRFPGKPFDCESLFVWGEHGYLISKVGNDAHAGLYRFGLADDAKVQTLELIGELPIDSPVTGAAISPDGSSLGIVTKGGAYLFEIDGELEKALRKKPFRCKFRHESIEGCTFIPEGLLATAESREIFVFSNESFEKKSGKKKR